MPRERIDRDWIAQHGGSVFEAHLNMGSAHQYCCAVVDKRDGRKIGLRYTDVSYKRTKRNGAKGGTRERVWWVDTHATEIASLDEALEILAIVRTADDPAGSGDRPEAAPLPITDETAAGAAAPKPEPETHHV